MSGPWTWRWRRGYIGRKPKPRMIWFLPPKVVYVPVDEMGRPVSTTGVVELYPDEIEALRLVYLEKLTQEEAAKRMGISRGTLWRLLDSGRRKLVQAIVELKAISIAKPSEESTTTRTPSPQQTGSSP